MRVHSVVISPRAFKGDLYNLECIEDFPVEQFNTKFGIEAFAIAVLPWAARHNAAALAPTRNPLPQSLGDEFRAIVGANMPMGARKMNKSIRTSMTSAAFSFSRP